MTDAEIEDLCIEAGLMHRTERGGIVLVFAEDLSRPEMVAGVRKLLELRASAATVAEPSYCEANCKVICQNSTHGFCNGAPTQQQAEPYTYASKQATKCAVCGEHKHTPLRIDRMGGYVCLTCIDKELEKEEQQAEPGADERAAFEAWADSKGWFMERADDGCYRAKEVECMFMGWEARAAQSGQRAGVAEVVLDYLKAHAVPSYQVKVTTNPESASLCQQQIVTVDCGSWGNLIEHIQRAAAPTQQEDPDA